mgnify:CR=1 FL=1
MLQEVGRGHAESEGNGDARDKGDNSHQDRHGIGIGLHSMSSQLKGDKDQQPSEYAEGNNRKALGLRKGECESHQDKPRDDIGPPGPGAKPVLGREPARSVAHGKPSERRRNQVHETRGFRQAVRRHLSVPEEVHRKERSGKNCVSYGQRQLRKNQVEGGKPPLRRSRNNQAGKGNGPERLRAAHCHSGGNTDSHHQQ